MSRSPKRIVPLIFVLPALIFSAGGSAATTSEPAYNWKPGEVLRFEYNHTITTSDNSGGPDQVFSFSGVLIVEVKARNKDQVSGFLHFDSPKVDLPESYWFQAISDEPLLDKDKARQTGRAIEGAIKAQRWNVTLDKRGMVTIDARQKTTDDWLRDESKTGGWRSRWNKYWIDIIDNQLGLNGSGEDRELFLCLAPPPAPVSTAVSPIRPVRSQSKLERIDDCKAFLSFTRQAPPDIAKGYSFANIGTPTVEMKLHPEILTAKGRATFDLTLNLPDTLEEDYSFKLDYQCLPERQKVTLHQSVAVSYSLKRLAPALRTCDEPVLHGP